MMTCEKLEDLLKSEILDQLTPSEYRKLKIDLKKNPDISQSKTLQQFLNRINSNIELVLNNHNVETVKRRRIDKTVRFADDYVKDDFIVSDSETDDDYSDNNQNYLYKLSKSDELTEQEKEKLKELQESQQNEINIKSIIQANFNKDDTLWFYKNIMRMESLEGSERFQLEDKIEKRYKFLISLQKSNMYSTFSKSGDRDIMQDILSSKHTDTVKTILLNKMYNVTYESLEEYQKALNWLDICLCIPTETKSSRINISDSIQKLYHKLTTSLYGMDSTIIEILQAVCTILSDPDNKGYILTLVGPPGVGKTSISSMISESIGMGFGQVSCGSINDQATIIGHGSTYIGSKPGIFTQYLINNGQLDNVILLDEMDKLHDSKIVPILLHILDKSQNSRFKDAFCPEINIDLSKNFYIIAVNSVDNLDEALKDRLKIVHVNGYDISTKVNICRHHIIPKLMHKTGIELDIDDDDIRKCILKVSPNISGVREIERFFGDIYEKLLLVRHIGPTFFNLPSNFNFTTLKKINMKLISNLTNIK